MSKIQAQLYISGVKLDMFDDERVEMNLNIKDFKQLDKTFGSYSQPFSVPASKTNNKVFEHYYNATVTSSFNPNASRDAVLEVSGVPYKTGLVRLEKVIVKGGEPQSYQLTFYDDVLGLKEILGETRLYEVPILDANDVTMYAQQSRRMDGIDTVVNYPSGIRDRRNAMFVPLISTERFLRWTNDATDPNDIATSPFAINEFRPALAVKYILDSIQDEFGINIVYPLADVGNPHGNNDSDAKECLYLWCNREAGVLRQVRQPWTLMETDSIVSDISGYWDPTGHWFEISNTTGNSTNYFVVVVDTDGNESVEYEVCAYNQSTGTIIDKQSGSGTKDYIFEIARPSSGTQNYQFYLRTGEPFVIGSNSGVFWADNSSLAPVISAIKLTDFVEPATGNGAQMYFNDFDYTTLGETYTAPGQLPNIRVYDFLVGLAKMFNWVIVANSSTSYTFKTLDTFYADGTTRDWSSYVDQLNYEATKVDFFGEISFKYEKSEMVLSEQYFKTAGGGERGYGDLITSILDVNGQPLSPESYEVKVPFSTIVWERPRTNRGSYASFYIANAVDDKGEATETAPLLMYYNRKATTPSSINIKISTDYDASTFDTFTSVNLASDRNIASSAFTQSINFGSEINIANNSPDSANAPTLYNTYYKDFITDLYDINARNYTFEAVLPLGEILGVELNDKIQIGFESYFINSINVDLTTGKAKLNLRNVIE